MSESEFSGFPVREAWQRKFAPQFKAQLWLPDKAVL